MCKRIDSDGSIANIADLIWVHKIRGTWQLKIAAAAFIREDHTYTILHMHKLN